MEKKNFVLMLSFVLLIPSFVKASEESTEKIIERIGTELKEQFKDLIGIEYVEEKSSSTLEKTGKGFLLKFEKRYVKNPPVGRICIITPKGIFTIMNLIPFHKQHSLLNNKDKEAIENHRQFLNDMKTCTSIVTKLENDTSLNETEKHKLFLALIERCKLLNLDNNNISEVYSSFKDDIFVNSVLRHATVEEFTKIKCNDQEKQQDIISNFQKKLLNSALILELQKNLSSDEVHMYAIKKIRDLELPSLKY